MAIRRTTIELDEDLIRAAQRATGTTLRATVEEGLRRVADEAKAEAAARMERQLEALRDLRNGIDVDVLLSGEAWR